MKVEIRKQFAGAKKVAFKNLLMMGILMVVTMGLFLNQADRLYSALNATETTETSLGTITVPSAGVKRIVGVYGQIMQPTSTAGEMISGYFRLAFKTVAGTFKFPAAVIGGAAGTLAANASNQKPLIIPVDIPVPANETITIYMAADVALTGTGTGLAGVIFE